MQFDAEKALIGAIIENPERVNDCGELQADMFQDDFLGRVFLEYQRAADLGRSLTLVELSSKFLDVSQEVFLDRIRGCADSSVVSTAASRYANIILNAYKAREATKAINSIKFVPDGIERQIGGLVDVLGALQRNGQRPATSLQDIVRQKSGDYFRQRDRERLLTGFPKLDDCLGGLEGGDVIVIGARPAVGKSAFAAQILLRMAQAGKRVMLFNLEMTTAQIYERLLARVSGIELQRIRRANSFLGDEKGRFERANIELSGLDLWISSGAKTVSQIRTACRHMDADCIIVDYLQLIRADRTFSNRAAEVGEISKSLKSLAMELDRPVILLSQLNRLSEGRENREPGMGELRESGDIEQDASTVLLLWNIDENDSARKGLKVAKNRQGELTRLSLRFSGSEMCFTEDKIPDFSTFKKIRSREVPDFT